MIDLVTYYLLKKISDKEILLMGPKSSGKTTLFNFLRSTKSSDIPPLPPIIGPIGLWNMYKILKLIMSNIIEKSVFTDSKGTDYYDDYHHVYYLLKEKKYDYIFYVYDLSKVIQEDMDYLNTILYRDFPKIKRSKINGIALIGTHIDKLSIPLEQAKRNLNIQNIENIISENKRKIKFSHKFLSLKDLYKYDKEVPIEDVKYKDIYEALVEVFIDLNK